LNTISYTFIETKGNRGFNEVHCKFKYDDKPVIVYYLYPKYLLNNKEQYINKAKKFIKTIKDNGELAEYIDNYLNAKSTKAYKFKTPFGYENITNIDEIIERIQNNSYTKEPAVKYKTVVKKVKSTGKSKKVAIGITSGIAVVATALAVYFYLRKPGGGGDTPIVSDTVAITFNAGEGLIDSSHSKTVTVAKNTKWSAIKEKPTPSLEGNRFNYWTINNKQIEEGYTFAENTSILADYTADKISITVSAAGGTFNDGTKIDKNFNVDYGTTWSDFIKKNPSIGIKEGPDGGSKFNSFRNSNNEAMNSETKLKKTSTITASYEAIGSTAITFSANGGTFNDGSTAFTTILGENVTWGEAKTKVASKNPTLDGHDFDNTYSYNGSVLTDDSFKFTEKSAVITANFTPKKFTITAYANGGKFADGTDTKKVTDVEYGKLWKNIKEQFEIKTLPTNQAFFRFSVDDSTSYLEDDMKITSNLNLSATYIKNEQCVLTIDAGEGTLKSISGHAEAKLVYKNATWGANKPNNPECEGKTFSGWTVNDKNIDDTYVITGDVTVKANYSNKQVSVTIDPNGGTFATGGGSDPVTIKVDYGSPWSKIKGTYAIGTCPTDKDFDAFRVGSGTGSDADVYIFTSDTNKIVASYKPKDTVTLTLDADGGKFDDTSSAKSVSVINGKKWSEVSTEILKDSPSKTGYTFIHYYLDKTHPETKIPEDTIFTSAKTLYAYYEVSEVNIHISIDTTKGTFTDTTLKYDTIPVKYGSTWGNENKYIEGTGFKYRITDKDGYSSLAFRYTTKSGETPTEFLDTKHVFYEETWIAVEFISSNSKTIVIDPNGGKFTGGIDYAQFATELSFESNTKWPVVKQLVEDKLGKDSITPISAPDGHEVKGFTYVDSTGTLGTLNENSDIKGSMIITVNYPALKVNVSLNAGAGGKYTSTGTNKKTITPNYGSFYDPNDKPDVINTDYEFAYYVVGTSTTQVDSYHKYEADETLNAKYYVTLKFDAGEGKLPGANTIKVIQGTTWGQIKDAFKATPKSTDYTFDGYSIGDTPVKDTDPFDAPVTLTANYSLNKPTAFETDSWDKFSQIVSQGYDFIKGNSHENGGYQEEFTAGGKNTFVGLERSIYLNGDPTEYKVRVIDQDVDTYGTESKKAALTFEFVNTISTSEFAISDTNVPYVDSTLRKRLQKELLTLMPSCLLDETYGIKKVKKISWNTSTNPNQYDDFEDKLFVLSASEMGYDAYPDYGIGVISEGEKYAYYNTASKITKKDKIYWIRSADLLVDGFVWAIDEEGKLGIENTSTGKHESRAIDAAAGVAPCFAI